MLVRIADVVDVDVVEGVVVERRAGYVADSEQQVRAFVDTNNHGTIRMIKAFRPLLNDGARFCDYAR